MEPMKPMKPWWPRQLGEPAAGGSQNQMRYAVFPARRILLVEIAGNLTAYDSGGHQIDSLANDRATMRPFPSVHKTKPCPLTW